MSLFSDEDVEVDFLNKVIVDQQTKIEGLNKKIKELESLISEEGVEEGDAGR